MTETVYCLEDCLVHGITTIEGTEATNTGEFLVLPPSYKGALTCEEVLPTYQWSRCPDEAWEMAENRRIRKMNELREMLDKVTHMTFDLPDLETA